MNDFLGQRIKAKEHQISKLSSQIRHLQKTRFEAEAELRAYRDVLDHIASPNAEFPPVDDESEQKSAANRLSETWKDILSEIAKAHPSALSVDDIRNIIKKLEKDVSDLTLRSQLSLYKGRKWLDNVGVGMYKITEKGAEAVGTTLIQDDDVDLLTVE